MRSYLAARHDDSRSIRMQEIRPESSPILGDVRVLTELCPVTMQSNSLTRGDSRAEFGPSLGETPFVHENEVESGLQRELVTGFLSVPTPLTTMRVSTSSRFSALTAVAMMTACLAVRGQLSTCQ